MANARPFPGDGLSIIELCGAENISHNAENNLSDPVSREVNVAAWLADSGRQTADLTDRVDRRAENDHRL